MCIYVYLYKLNKMSPINNLNKQVFQYILYLIPTSCTTIAIENNKKMVIHNFK